ncbi:MAG: alpha-L-fucosidase [Thermoguttaceae bacterium]
MKRTCTATVALTLALAIAAGAAEPVDMARRAEELKNLRWGMFVCWSFSTFSGKEWTPGVTDVSFFKASGCDTDQWARTAKEAGMGYILFLTKHHDGFCLWDTRTTDRKVTQSPLGRDVLAELRKSCDKYGIKLALYFSEGDWTWPGAADGKGWKEGVGKNPEMKKAQLKELLTGYGPIEYIWFDHAVGDGGLDHRETIAWCKSLQPGCFVGFNHGDQAGADIRLGELGRPGPLEDTSAAGPYMKDAASRDYRLAEFTYPILPPHQGGAMWFYSLPIHDGLCHPAAKLYADYLGAVKYGNIFSLDVGPDYAGRLREIDVKTLREVGRIIRGEPGQGDPAAQQPAAAQTDGTKADTAPIRAFCIDFNWGPGGPNGFAKPGLWADADPAAHVAWYEQLGCNVIQTFAVSCNGHAWYKGDAVPEQPGLKHDFLPEMVKLGHAKGMRVMGYFCIGANTRWGQEHPDLSYGFPSAYHIPLTDAYLDYLGTAIADSLGKSGMDGFMIDWVWCPTDAVRKQTNGGRWLEVEKKLYETLMAKPFPGEDQLAAEDRLAYERKAIDRCWGRIRSAAKAVNPNCVIWLSCNQVHDPTIAGSAMLREVDWMMDEAGTPAAMKEAAGMFGPHTRQLLCLAGWGDRHKTREILSDPAIAAYGIYGFSRPNPDSLPLPVATCLARPIDSFTGNDRGIATLARFFTGKPFDFTTDKP